jgi:uncharacterized protein YqfB (UPF0267 family)
MLHYLIHHKHRRGWHREGETKQELSQLRMLQMGDGLMPETKTTLVSVKDAEEHRFAQFQKEIVSRKKVMKVKDKSWAEFQNEMNSMKMLIKVQDERHAQFQNEMNSKKMLIKVQGERHAQFQNEMNSK